MDKYSIALDAMGGDSAPEITVKGAVRAIQKLPVKIFLVGDEVQIAAELAQVRGSYNPDQLEIIHTDQQITMHDHPKATLDLRPRASIALAAKLVGEHKADALVSAGNTGAVILSAAKYINRIPGVRKTALAALYPTHNRQKREELFSLILDVGANIHNTHHDLIHFAYMASTYVNRIKNIEKPTVGLLNVGKEEYKGGALLAKTHKILSELPDINFIGNIEGNELLQGYADVVVTEGLTGNIAIKTAEGMASSAKHLGKRALRHPLYMFGMLMLAGGIRRIKNITDYQEYGGAPVFGFERMVIKCHGRSGPRAIDNAIQLAVRSISQNMTENISSGIRAYEAKYAVNDMDLASDYY